MKKQKLAVIALGKRNAGKSSTWYEIYGRRLYGGWRPLQIGKEGIEIFLKNSSFEETNKKIPDYLDVYLKNSSFEEEDEDAEYYFENKDWFEKLPEIIFCSVQYTEHGIETLNWFKQNGYYLYIQWLNPGYFATKEYSDYLEFEKKLSPYGTFAKFSGWEKSERIEEIKKFLYNWILKKQHDTFTI